MVVTFLISPAMICEPETSDALAPEREREKKECKRNVFKGRRIEKMEYINIFSFLVRTGWFGHRSIMLPGNNRPSITAEFLVIGRHIERFFSYPNTQWGRHMIKKI